MVVRSDARSGTLSVECGTTSDLDESLRGLFPVFRQPPHLVLSVGWMMS